jgi:type II secretory pathway component PulC
MKTKGHIAKFMLGNVSMLNMILFVTAVFFLLYLLLPQYRLNVFDLSPVSRKHPPQEKAEVKAGIPSISDFTIISDQNLFHPERKIPVEKKAEEKSLPMPEPEYVLHGTLVSDSLSIAYLEDAKEPRNTIGRGKRQITLRKGEALSGFTLKEIYTDKIVMVRGNEELTVSMQDSHTKIKKGLVSQRSPLTGAVGQSQGSQNAVGTLKQPQVEKKAGPPQRMIDQDVFNFLNRQQKK